MNFTTSKVFYYRIAQITPIAVFVLMMLGSYVKAINAGLSCPDWPLCYGQLYPGNIVGVGFTFNQIMAEYLHRVFALLVTLLIIYLMILSFYHRADIAYDDEKIGYKRLRMMVSVNILLVIQVIFGALTVLLNLEPTIVSIHLGVATIIFGGTIFHLSWIKKNSQLNFR